MTFASPHAIRLNPANFHEIVSTCYASFDALAELYKESQEWGMPWYIVAKRLDSGRMDWEPMTAVEVCVEFKLKKFLDHRYDHHFYKI